MATKIQISSTKHDAPIEFEGALMITSYEGMRLQDSSAMNFQLSAGAVVQALQDYCAKIGYQQSYQVRGAGDDYPVIKGYTVKATYKFPNGMVATVGFDDQQISELQGPWTPELEEKIKNKSGILTEWHGF